MPRYRILLAVALFGSIPGVVLSEEWEWTVAPYVWASDVAMDASINENPTLGFATQIPFKDIVDKLDTGFMGHIEGIKGNRGLYLDFVAISLSDQSTVTIEPGGPIVGDVAVDLGLDMGIYDLGALRRFELDEDSATVIDFLVGIRIIEIDVAANLTLPGPGMNELDVNAGPSETDAMLGGRLTGEFSKRWTWLLRADMSFGGSDGTTNAIGAIGYRFGESGTFALDFGYRYMSMGFRNRASSGGYIETDLTLSGPVVGFIFNF